MFKNGTISFFYGFIKPHWHLALKAIILGTIVSVLEVINTSLVFPLIQLLGQSQINPNLQTSNFLTWLLNLYTSFPNNLHLPLIIGSLLLITLFKNITCYFSNVTNTDFMLRGGTLLRQKCIERVLELEVPFFVQTGTGEVLSNVNEQAQRSERLFCHFLELLRELLTVTLLFFLLVSLSPTLTAITVFSLAIVLVSLKTVIRGIQYHGRQAARAIEDFSVLVTEIITGIRVVKSFNAELRELDNAKKSLAVRYNADLKAHKFYSAVTPVTETAGIVILLVILIGGTTVLSQSGATTLPILLTFALALLRMLPKVNHLYGLRADIVLLLSSVEIIQEFLTSTANLGLKDGKKLYQGFKSELVFENLTFTFPTNSEPTLHNIHLRVEKGKTTAIVGSSGSGKSTLVDLVMRFYEPDSGCIKIDDTDLKDLQIGSWRRAIAMVSQDTFLFNASVRDNIAYGRPDATEYEIIAATKKAHAYDFIQELPEGLDTIVGNRGTRLSGGQRQRIAIARAILCDPDILILDEATSALDSKSERIVQQAIEEVSRDRTVIVIAHRLSTIEKAHKIVVLQNGKLLEQGTHQELLLNKGIYYSLYKSQTFSDTPVTHHK